MAKYTGKLPQPQGKERIPLVKSAADRGVPFAVILREWQQEQIAAIMEAKAQEKLARKQKSAPKKLQIPDPEDDMDINIDDGPNYEITEDVEGPRIPPFIKLQIYNHFRRLSLTQNEATIMVLHDLAMVDPNTFSAVHGPDLTRLIIQL